MGDFSYILLYPFPDVGGLPIERSMRGNEEVPTLWGGNLYQTPTPTEGHQSFHTLIENFFFPGFKFPLQYFLSFVDRRKIVLLILCQIHKTAVTWFFLFVF